MLYVWTFKLSSNGVVTVCDKKIKTISRLLSIFHHYTCAIGGLPRICHDIQSGKLVNYFVKAYKANFPRSTQASI